MKKILAWIIVLFCFINANAQDIISSTFIVKYPKSYFNENYGLFANYEVELHRIKYTAKDAKGKPSTASGLVCLPVGSKKGHPFVVYHHGTVDHRYDVPGYGSYEVQIPSIFTCLGYIAVAPDYIGLGDSPGTHPYVHAASEASASLEMMIAAEKFIQSKGYFNTKDVFITGYSQGGHAGMALHRLLESNANGFKLIAASHMSGPYNISGNMRNLLLSNDAYVAVSYLVAVALSYDYMYGIIPNGDISKFFKPTFLNDIKEYKLEKIGLFDLNDRLLDSLTKYYGKGLPKKLIQDDIVDSVLQNDNHPINIALRDNDVYDFKSTVPTRLIYCKADDQVVYTNSLTAESKLKANGSPDVTAVDVKTDGDHGQCVNPAVTSTIFFFFPYQLITGNKEEPIAKIGVYPNPSNGVIHIKSDVMYSHANVISSSGKTYPYIIEDNQLDIRNLPTGQYMIQMIDSDGKVVMAKFQKL